jgi:hypothetical protein
MSKVERDPLTIVGWRDINGTFVCQKCSHRLNQIDPIYVGTDESRERCKTCGNFLDLDDFDAEDEGPR